MANPSSQAATGERRVFLVTHGRTSCDTDDLLPGDGDEPLDDVGRVEALALAETLDYVHPARVLSSPLRWARATAEVIAIHAGLSVVPEPRLNERGYGRWGGRSRAAAYTDRGEDPVADGIEPAEQVVRRARAVLDEQIPGLGPTGPVVLVTHHEVARLLLADLDLSSTKLAGSPRRTAAWNVLVADGDRWQVLDIAEQPGDLEPGE